jgi:hypothetical protein
MGTLMNQVGLEPTRQMHVGLPLSFSGALVYGSQAFFNEVQITVYSSQAREIVLTICSLTKKDSGKVDQIKRCQQEIRRKINLMVAFIR